METLQDYYNKILDLSQVIEKFRQKYIYQFFNINTYQVIESVFEFKKYYFDLFGFYKNKVIYFSNLYDNKNHNFFFLTLTLPGEYHFFKQDKSKTIVRNKKCHLGLFESISQGGEILYNTFRMFYKRLKDRIGYEKLDYIYFFEFHKSLTPHLHLLFVLDKSVDVRMIYDLFNKVIKENNLNSVGCDIKKLNDNKHTINYVTKYITKTIEQIKKGTDFVYLLDGWKRVLGKRLFGSSRFLPIRTDFIKRIYRRLKSKVKKEKGFDVISKVQSFIQNKTLNILTVITKRVEMFQIDINGKRFNISKMGLDYLLSKLSDDYSTSRIIILYKMKKQGFKDYKSVASEMFGLERYKIRYEARLTHLGFPYTMVDEIKEPIELNIRIVKRYTKVYRYTKLNGLFDNGVYYQFNDWEFEMKRNF